MGVTDHDIAALIGSRICHDLISPIGAIGNGVELLEMTGAGDGAEIALISDSVNHANARIRYYRLAFGAGSDVSRIGRSEITGILDDIAKTGRISFNWGISGDVTRNEAKLALLLIMCFELAMPYGGAVQLSEDAGRWRVEAMADKLKIEDALWAVLDGNIGPDADITPGKVQFLLAADMLAARPGEVHRTATDDSLIITY